MEKRTDLTPIAALAAAGVLWGLTVPLSKLALGWMAPAWLTGTRFLLAVPVLAVIGRRGLRAALELPVLLAGAVGFGVVLMLQNAGIARTSVSHAALLVGAVPVLVALLAAARRQASSRPLTWGGYGLALAGVALVARGGGGGASVTGDLLVLASAALSALFIYIQPRLLEGRDAAAVTAVQFGAGALVAWPVALLAEPTPAASPGFGALAALVALVLVGTVLPFWLFAYGQSRVPAQLAGAYVNLEPLVGAAVGWISFGNPAGTGQLLGALAVLIGVVLSGLPSRRSTSSAPESTSARPPARLISFRPAAGR